MSTLTATPVSDISEVLQRLGIEQVNSGACTGTQWLSTSGERIDSFSPADGQLIGSIKQATAADYETIIALFSRLLTSGDWCPLPNAVK
ncbi:MAG: hypothetical protein IPL74_01470 [Bacteroidetes bacterium]|nr:hypothetical protein [Bacteroidota bacterium]